MSEVGDSDASIIFLMSCSSMYSGRAISRNPNACERVKQVQWGMKESKAHISKKKRKKVGIPEKIGPSVQNLQKPGTS